MDRSVIDILSGDKSDSVVFFPRADDGEIKHKLRCLHPDMLICEGEEIVWGGKRFENGTQAFRYSKKMPKDEWLLQMRKFASLFCRGEYLFVDNENGGAVHLLSTENDSDTVLGVYEYVEAGGAKDSGKVSILLENASVVGHVMIFSLILTMNEYPQLKELTSVQFSFRIK